MVGLARSGYYAWRGRGAPGGETADIELTEMFRLVHRRSRGTYGYPRVHAEQRGRQAVGRNRIARLVRAAGLSGCGPRRRVYTTRTDKDAAPAADLVERRFLAEAPDRLWLADITSVPTLEG